MNKFVNLKSFIDIWWCEFFTRLFFFYNGDWWLLHNCLLHRPLRYLNGLRHHIFISVSPPYFFLNSTYIWVVDHTYSTTFVHQLKYFELKLLFRKTGLFLESKIECRIHWWKIAWSILFFSGSLFFTFKSIHVVSKSCTFQNHRLIHEFIMKKSITSQPNYTAEIYTWCNFKISFHFFFLWTRYIYAVSWKMVCNWMKAGIRRIIFFSYSDVVLHCDDEAPRLRHISFILCWAHYFTYGSLISCQLNPAGSTDFVFSQNILHRQFTFLI